jgi:hypothetical protein
MFKRKAVLKNPGTLSTPKWDERGLIGNVSDCNAAS